MRFALGFWLMGSLRAVRTDHEWKDTTSIDNLVGIFSQLPRLLGQVRTISSWSCPTVSKQRERALAPTWEAEIDTKRSVSLRERIYGCFTVKIWNVPSIYEFTFLNNEVEGFVSYSRSARAA
jgi:hypothetical protein